MVVDEVNNSRVTESSPGRRKRWRWIAMMALGASLTTATGCTAWTGMTQAWQYNHYWNDTVMGYRHTSMASKAWHSRKHCFAHHKYLKDFARGFKAGYMEVAAGGKGCTPAFPPREYWGWKYQSCEGQARVAAWFEGFPYGAQAAEQDGIGNWTQLQTSKAIQSEYVDHGRMPTEYNGMYPVPPIQPGFGMLPAKPANPPVEMMQESLLDSSADGFEDGEFMIQQISPVVPTQDPTFQ